MRRLRKCRCYPYRSMSRMAGTKETGCVVCVSEVGDDTLAEGGCGAQGLVTGMRGDLRRGETLEAETSVAKAVPRKLLSVDVGTSVGET